MTLSKKTEKIFTYADYLTWIDGKRWEIIDGVPTEMSAPSTTHQRISTKLVILLGNFLANKECEIFAAPFDVVLEAHQESKTVIQPDISIICDPSKIKERGCFGVPDLVIEIISPSTALRDFNTKFYQYETFGVKEYWIVSPVEKEISVYKLIDGKYQEHNVYSKILKVAFGNAPAVEIDLSSIFN